MDTRRPIQRWMSWIRLHEAWWWVVLPAIGVLVVGTVRLDDTSMWMDETFTAEAARLPLLDMLRFLRIEAGMGPYYLSLWVWARVTGYSPEAIRMWSVIGASVAAAVFGALLRRRCRSTTKSGSFVLIGLVLFLGHPLFIKMIVEARAYSWMMAGSTIALLLLDLHLVTPSLSHVAWIATTTGVFGAMHPVSLYFHVTILGLAIAALPPPRRAIRRLLAALLPSLIALPFLWVMFVRGRRQVRWIGEFEFGSVRAELSSFLAGSPLFALLIGLGAVASIRSWQKREPIGNRALHFRHELLLLAPLVLVALQSLRVNGFIHRYMTPTLPSLALQAARGAWLPSRILSQRGTKVGGAVVMLVALVSIPSHDLPAEPGRAFDHRRVARILDAMDWTGTQLVVPTSHQAIWFYANDDVRTAWYPTPDGDLRPWDRFRPNMPIGAPRSCRVVVMDPADATSLTGQIERFFDPEWLTDTNLVSASTILNFNVYEFRNPACG